MAEREQAADDDLPEQEVLLALAATLVAAAQAEKTLRNRRWEEEGPALMNMFHL